MQETLPHAVARMRAQGFNDHQIAGQIHQWHSGWTPDQITALLRPQPAHVTVAQPRYHGTSLQPFFPGQKPDHLAGPRMTPVYVLGKGHPSAPAFTTLLGGPAAGLSEGQSQAALAHIYKQNHPLGQQLIEGLANTVPGVALAKGIRDSNVNFGTLGSEAFNDVTSGLLPVGKAAALFGGLRGLRKVRDAATAVEDVSKVAKAARPAPYVASGNEGIDELPDFGKGFSYHRAPASSFAGIQKSGLKGLTPKADVPGVYFGQSPLAARGLSWKSLKGSVFVRAKTASLRDVTERAFGEHVTPHSVPASNLEYLGADKQWHPVALPKAGATQIPDEAAQLRPVLSGKAGSDVSAKRAYKAEAQLRTEERSARLTKANEHLANKSLDPTERIRLWKEEMKGELPKIQWRGFDALDANTVKAMTRYALDEAPNLLGTQRVRVVGALENAVNGIVPRPHELKLLEHVFGKDVTKGFTQLASHPVRDAIIGALNIPRTLMASMDFSAPLRQGLVAGARHPVISAKNFPEMFKSFASEKSFQALGDEIKARPTFPLMLEADLPLTGLDRGVGQAEEAFAGVNVTEKFTGGKRFSPVRMSDRAYTAYLDKTRADVFDVLIRQAQSQGKDVQDPKFLHDLGHFIGNATGRGTFDHQALEQAMPLLNIGLFSPRLIASRVQLINPVYYVRLDPFVRKEALASALSTFGAISTVLGLAAAAGAKVSSDWRSSDFGKIRMGNTRIDIGGGFNQYFHLLGEIVSGQRINSTTGEVTSLRHPKFGQQSTWDALVNFARGKEAPLPSIATDWLTGKSGIGQPFSTSAELKNHFVPLIFQDAKDLYKQPFHGMNGIEAALAGYAVEMFGTGLQTYTQQPSKSTGSSDPFDSTPGSSGDPFDSSPGSSSGDPFDNVP